MIPLDRMGSDERNIERIEDLRYSGMALHGRDRKIAGSGKADGARQNNAQGGNTLYRRTVEILVGS